MKRNRHGPLEGIIVELNKKLRGYYQYYGITFNSKQLNLYYEEVKRLLYKWTNRCGAGELLSWKRYSLRVNVWSPLAKPKIYHSFVLAKP
jgi:hypothetical protein